VLFGVYSAMVTVRVYSLWMVFRRAYWPVLVMSVGSPLFFVQKAGVAFLPVVG
jgi:hypothetical protein